MSIKIQLNSLQALERLIGGDTEIELEIRNSIAQAFAKKHLKPLAESVTHGLTSAVRIECEKVLIDTIGHFDDPKSYYKKFILNTKIDEAIREAARLAVSEEIKQFVKDEVQKYLDHKATDKFFFSSMRDYIDKTLTGPLFHNAVIEKVEEKLKMIMERLKN